MDFLGIGGLACMVLVILGGIILIVGLWFVVTYNGLVRLRTPSRTPGARSTSSSSGGTT